MPRANAWMKKRWLPPGGVARDRAAFSRGRRCPLPRGPSHSLVGVTNLEPRTRKVSRPRPTICPRRSPRFSPGCPSLGAYAISRVALNRRGTRSTRRAPLGRFLNYRRSCFPTRRPPKAPPLLTPCSNSLRWPSPHRRSRRFYPRAFTCFFAGCLVCGLVQIPSALKSHLRIMAARPALSTRNLDRIARADHRSMNCTAAGRADFLSREPILGRRLGLSISGKTTAVLMQVIRG